MDRFIIKLALLLSLFTFLPSVQAGSQQVIDFARFPQFAEPALSPDGESIAYLMQHEGKPAIITRPLDPANTQHKVGAIPLNGAQLQWFNWVNNDRLLVAIRLSVDKTGVTNQLYSLKMERYNIVRIFSIDRSGEKPVYFDMKPNKYGISLLYPRLISPMYDDPEHVLLSLDVAKDSWNNPQVHKVNIYTGEKTLVEANRGGYDYFLADSDTGDLKLAYKYGVGSGTQLAYYRRTASQKGWTLWQKRNLTTAARFFRSEWITPGRMYYWCTPMISVKWGATKTVSNSQS